MPQSSWGRGGDEGVCRCRECRGLFYGLGARILRASFPLGVVDFCCVDCLRLGVSKGGAMMACAQEEGGGKRWGSRGGCILHGVLIAMCLFSGVRLRREVDGENGQLTIQGRGDLDGSGGLGELREAREGKVVEKVEEPLIVS